MEGDFSTDELYFIYDRVGEDERLKNKIWKIIKEREMLNNAKNV